MLRNFLLTFLSAWAALVLTAGIWALRLWLRDVRRASPTPPVTNGDER